MKWYKLDHKSVNGERWEKYRTEKKGGVFPSAIVYREGDVCHWAVYGRNGWDRITGGNHADLTQAQIEAEKALKAWMVENE